MGKDDAQASNETGDSQDLTALLLQPDAATPATETTAPTQQQTETPAATEGTEGQVAEGATDAATQTETQTTAEPTPGTPDKVLQRMQQDLSTAIRQIGELNQAVAAGQTLTPKQQQQQATIQRKVESIKQQLQQKKFDPYDNGTALAESLVEMDQENQELKQQVNQLAERLDASIQTQQVSQADQSWVRAEQMYPGVDVKSVMAKCIEDAVAVIGDDDPAKVHRLASHTFHQRAGAAVKSITAKKPPAQPAPKQAPAVTPNGTKVTVQQTGVATPATVSEEQRMLNDYMALVKSE